jgi:5-methylcytosine-specific restriction protein A
MPTAPLRPCIETGCSALVVCGRCPRHAVQREHQRNNYAIRRWYRTLRWRYLRAQVLREQAYECAQCHHVQVELEVDHIVKHDGHPARFWDRTNLQALCPACHSAKTARGE